MSLETQARLLINQIKTSDSFRKIEESERVAGKYIVRNGKKLLSFSCNDYFGLSQHPQVIEAAISATRKYGTGAGASRLITGNHPLYEELESFLSKIKGTESACVFGSGYLANTGVIPALAGKGDLILADRLVHACIIDGIKLSGANFKRFSHNSASNLRKLLKQSRRKYKNCLIITETIFSMDGDRAPIKEIIKFSREFDCWVMTDDAHGIGIVEANPQVDVQMGTLSKGVGSYGGYVCGKKEVIELIKNKARSLIYSTALPPATIAASIAALKIIKSDKKKTEKPLKLAKLFARNLGLTEAQSAIVSVVLGEEKAALATQKKLASKGFYVHAIRPPTVPKGTSRLRFTFSSLHNEEEVESLVSFIAKHKFVTLNSFQGPPINILSP